MKSFGSVAYSEDASFATSTYASEISESDSIKKADHTIKLTNLKPNTKYHYSVKSYVFQQAPAKTGDLAFITKASKVQAQALDRKNDSFRVVWNTDEETSSIVEYKKQGSAAGDKKSDTTMTLYHDMLIDNLLPGTAYEVKVYGYNKDGNFIEAKEILLVTTTRDTTPPVIASFKVDSALVPGRKDRTQTVVSWKTDEPSTSIVKYEEGSGSPEATLANKQEDTTTLTTNHTIILTTLKPGTIYRFQIGSSDQAGNASTLPVRTIITPRQTESVVDVIFKNFEDTFRFVNNPR
ncbi:MAG: Fibronectin type III domain protein [Parcubacteria group bacterium GW2011_GWA2_53_21]|nr:MAG: Fibronectin type III domain protein [Parcubacteria group bacterium GW2011_GWA2_53_21]